MPVAALFPRLQNASNPTPVRYHEDTSSLWLANRCTTLVMLTNSPDKKVFFALITGYMMTSSNWNIFRGTGHLCGEFTGPTGQWRGALMFSLICVWINDSRVNNPEAGDLRRYRAHYDVIVMVCATEKSQGARSGVIAEYNKSLWWWANKIYLVQNSDAEVNETEI